jgi:hypothetical protein
MRRWGSCANAWAEAIAGGVRLELSDLERLELQETLARDLEHFVRQDVELGLPLVPRRFEVGFGTSSAPVELQRGLELGGFTVSGKIDRIDVDPFSARGIVQDYKLGRAHGARDIETEHKLQIPLYILALRDLVGMEPLGGLYRGLTGTREARGLVRAEAREDAVPGLKRPDYLSEDDFWHQVDEAQARARRAVDRMHVGATCAPILGRANALAGAPSGQCAGSDTHEDDAVRPAGRRDRRAGRRLRLGRRGHRERRPSWSSASSRRSASAVLGIDNVLVITYTERAAGELRSRIRERLVEAGRHDLARDLDGGWISTIHGFCHRLLRAHPFEAGLDPRFRVLDESQSAVLRSEAFAEALATYVEGGEPERGAPAGHVRGRGPARDAHERL